MKKLFLWLFLCGVTLLFGQNSLNSGAFDTGTWGSGQGMTASAGGSLIITKFTSTSGDKFFRFYGDGSPCGEYRPNFDGEPFNHSIAYTSSSNCGNAGAWKVNVPINNSNVVFKTDGENNGIDKSIAFVVQGAVQSVSSVSQSPSTSTVDNSNTVTITANLSGSFAAGQAAYLRYTTNNFSTTTVVKMTGSGTVYTAQIPIFATGTTVRYYVFTSGDGTVGNADGPAANGSDADFRTINLINNGGSNYSYTVLASESISTGVITPTTLCAGATINIPYTATGTFNAGNTFTAQLSNASGSFATPTNIRSATSTTSGTITATIPSNTAYGTGYRIRVISSNPNVTGGNNGSDLTIYPPISSAIIQDPKTGTVCENAAFTVYGRVGIAGITNNDGTPFAQLTAQFGYGTSNDPNTWTWVAAAHNTQGASIDGTKDEYNYTIPANTLSAGTYYYGFKFKVGACTEVIAGRNGFFNNDPGQLTVSQSTKITTQPTVTQTVNLYAHTTLSVAASANSSGPVTYQWFKNPMNSNVGGTAIPGETNATYVVNTYTAGTSYYYAVASTGSGSCDSAASNVATVNVNDAATSGTANWANIQSPKMETDVYLGVGIDVFAQVFVPGAGGTPGPGQAPDIKAWIGYSTTNTNPNTWAPEQWKVAVINPFQAHLTANNDEYMIQEFGADLPVGTYYVASRFQKGTGAFVYGGTEDTTDNVSGGIWGTGPYKSLKLNINKIVTWVPNAGATSGMWNNINGPVITSPAVIDTHISSPPSFSAKSLTVNNGVGLTIATGQSVTLDGPLINNNGTSTTNTVVLQNDANLIQTNATIPNSGNIRVERNAVVPSNQYNFWSSPVTGQNLYTFYQSGIPVAPRRVFTYNTLTDYYTAVNAGTFTPGVGYSIKGENNGFSKAAFVGVPNNGDVSVNLVSGGQRYNLIGNPYPSNIVAEPFRSENADKIEATLWFWDNTGNTALTQMGSGYDGYGPNNFAQYNIASGVGNSGTGIPNQASKVPNGTIVVGQGFIVQAKAGSTNPSITFKNNIRTAANGVFFTKQNQQKEVFWLQLIAPSQLTNTAAVVYKNEAQNLYDLYDSELSSLSSDAVYTLADNDAKKLSIQGRNAAQLADDKVKVGVQFYQDGNYTFALHDKQGIFASGQSIYLHDKQTNSYTNLQTGNYTFAAVKGLDENRFEIVYKENAVLGNDETKTSAFQIYRDGTDFVIQSDKNLGRVEVYNMAGQLLKTFVSNAKTFKIAGSELPSGVYIIKADNSGDARTKKIIK